MGASRRRSWSTPRARAPSLWPPASRATSRSHTTAATIFVDDAADVLETVRSLVADAALAERLRAEGRRRAQDFAVDAVMADWERLLADVPTTNRLTVVPHLALVSGRAARAAFRRVRRALSSLSRPSG